MKLKDIPVFIDVYMPIAGWKARMMAWDEEMQMHVPEQTAYFAYATKAEAVRDAKEWAKCEGVPYVNTCPDQTQDAPDKSVEEQLRDIFGPIEVIHLD